MAIIAAQDPNRAEATWERPGRPTVAGAEYDLATLMPSHDSAVEIAVNHVGEEQINRNLAWGRANGDERGEYAYVELKEMSALDRAKVEQAWTERGMEGEPKSSATFRVKVDQSDPLQPLSASEARDVKSDMYFNRWHQVATGNQIRDSVDRMEREDDTRTGTEKIADGARAGAGLAAATMVMIGAGTGLGLLFEFGGAALVEGASTVGFGNLAAGVGTMAAGVAGGLGIGAAAGAAWKGSGVALDRVKEWAKGLGPAHEKARDSTPAKAMANESARQSALEPGRMERAVRGEAVRAAQRDINQELVHAHKRHDPLAQRWAQGLELNDLQHKVMERTEQQIAKMEREGAKASAGGETAGRDHGAGDREVFRINKSHFDESTRSDTPWIVEATQIGGARSGSEMTLRLKDEQIMQIGDGSLGETSERVNMTGMRSAENNTLRLTDDQLERMADGSCSVRGKMTGPERNTARTGAERKPVHVPQHGFGV